MKPSQFLLCLVSVLFALNLNASEPPKSRPEKWARPLDMKGVPNFFMVSPDLYRSAQPTSLGMKNLKKLGITTIVNLRSFHSDRDELAGTGLGYEHIHMKAWHPEEKEVIRFIRIVTDDQKTPVLVHCQHGADRTGTMCAVYRILICGWTKQEALDEMTKGGFGYHKIWFNLVNYIEKLDVRSLKKKLNMKAK